MNKVETRTRSTPGTSQPITRQLLIGLHLTVSNSRCGSHRGLKGVVVDETANMVVLDERGRRRKIPKNASTFAVTLPDDSVIHVDGASLVGRIEDRLKKLARGWS